MLKHNFIITLLSAIIFSISISASANEQEKFNQLIEDNNMIFNMPKDFTPTPVVDNEDVSYQFAIKHKKKKLQVRYSVWPVEEDYYKNSDLSRSKFLFYTFTMAVVENIVGGESYREAVFHSLGVRNEFNADAGASYAAEAKSEFSKGYKYVIIIAIHKNNVADAYTIFLCDDFNDIIGEFNAAFHSMKFIPDDLNTTSIIFSAANVISNIQQKEIPIDDIAKKIGFDPLSKLSKDDWLIKIANAYSLKLNKIDVNDTQKFVDLIKDGIKIIVIYKDKKNNHSVVVIGYKAPKNILSFIIHDLTINEIYEIDASSQSSDYWQTKIDRAYYFSK